MSLFCGVTPRPRPLLITTFCYLLTAWGFYKDGNLGLGLAFFGYAFANLGFLYIVIWGAP